MTKLLEHFKAMQGMASQYLTPEPYQGFTDGNKQVLVGTEQDDKETFIRDMIYMLDGPGQREAQTDAESNSAEFCELLNQAQLMAGDVRDENRMLRDRIAVAESDKGRATAALGEERKKQNELRDMLMRSELNYAKLRGYLEGKLDSAPPVMVPREREPFHAGLPNASGPSSTGWNAPAWYHRS